MNGRGPRWVTDVVVPIVILVLFLLAMSFAAWMAGPS